MNIQYTSGTTGFPERLHAVAPVLAHDRQGQRAPRRRGLRANPRLDAFLLHGPAVAADDELLSARDALRRVAAEREPVHGVGAHLPHPVLPLSRDRLQAAAVAAGSRERGDPRQRLRIAQGNSRGARAALRFRRPRGVRHDRGRLRPLHADRGDRHGRVGIVRDSRAVSRSAHRRPGRDAGRARRDRRAAAARARDARARITESPKRPRRHSTATGSAPAICFARTSAATTTSSAGSRK